MLNERASNGFEGSCQAQASCVAYSGCACVPPQNSGAIPEWETFEKCRYAFNDLCTASLRISFCMQWILGLSTNRFWLSPRYQKDELIHRLHEYPGEVGRRPRPWLHGAKGSRNRGRHWSIFRIWRFHPSELSWCLQLEDRRESRTALLNTSLLTRSPTEMLYTMGQ